MLERLLIYMREAHSITDWRAVHESQLRDFALYTATRHPSPRGKRISAATLRQWLSIVRSFFGWLNRNGRLLHNPAERLALPRPEQSLPQVLNETEFARLIETPDLQTAIGLRDRALMEVLYATGIRHAEAHKLLIFSTDISVDLLGQSKALNASSFAVAQTLGEKNSLEDTIGVITLNKKSHTKARRLRFFNEDGSLWYEFSFYDDNADHSFDRAKTEFEPFSFHRDYFVLALKCVGKDANRFQVVVNESTRLTKFIRRRDDSFKFQTWKEHILDLFAVGFDPANNSLRTGPRENVSTLRLPSEEVTFHPLQIKGNWLKVSWNVSDDSKGRNKKVKYGWVKWKQNSELLIEFFYFS